MTDCRNNSEACDLLFRAVALDPSLQNDMDKMCARTGWTWSREMKRALKDPRWQEAIMLAKLGGDGNGRSQ